MQSPPGYFPSFDAQRGRRMWNAGAERVGRSEDYDPVPVGTTPRSLLLNDGNPADTCEIVTLSIGVVPSRRKDVLDDALLRAQLRFGTGGTSEVVRFDVEAGLMLSFPTSVVDLGIIYEGTRGPRVKVAASIAPWTRPFGQGSTVRLSDVANLAAAGVGDNATFFVPRRAVAVAVRTTGAPASLRVDALLNAAVGAIAYTTTADLIASDPAALQLDTEVEAIKITNTGAAAQRVTVLWLLAI